MLRDVVIHMDNEQPLMADLPADPTALDTCVICTNLRTMSGKTPVFAERSDSTFVFPMAHIRFVEIRPASVEDRREVGHWEIDTVMGTEHGRNSVLTLVERATGYTLMGKLERHCAADTVARCVELIEREAGRVLTITSDNGTEFHSYAEIEAATGALRRALVLRGCRWA